MFGAGRIGVGKGHVFVVESGLGTPLLTTELTAGQGEND